MTKTAHSTSPANYTQAIEPEPITVPERVPTDVDLPRENSESDN
jgi:hypothetical protein